MNFLTEHITISITSIAFLVSLAIYYSFSFLSNRFGIYRITNDNKKVPKFVGGILSFSFLLNMWLVYFAQDYFQIIIDLKNLIFLSIGVILLFIVGYYFDNNQIVGKKKIIIISLAIILISFFTNKFDLFNFENIKYANVINYSLNLLTTIVFYELVINGVNILRKLDLLVPGISLIASVSFIFTTLLTGNYELISLAAIIVANSLILTLCNVKVNNIIGLTLGYILGYISIGCQVQNSILLIVAVLILGLPIFNLCYVVIKRLKKGTIISVRDQEHVFLKMAEKGYSNVKIISIFYLTTFFVATCGYIFAKFENPYFLLGALVILFLFTLALEIKPKKTHKLKVMSIFGTRPEAIKMAPVIKELESCEEIESVVCVTGQHKEMLYQVLDAFEIYPKYDLNIMRNRQTLVGISSRILKVLEKVVKREKPDLILVHGDTTSTYVAAFLGYYMNVEVGHVEAGLRTYNRREPFPEEMNRVLTGALATYHFSPSKTAKENLLKEGVPEENIFITGNTAVDSTKLTYKEDYNFKEQIINQVDFKNNKVIVMTAHRRENLGEPLENICRAVKRLVTENKDVVVIYAVHKNPAVRDTVYSILKGLDRVLLVEPLDVMDMHNLMKRSYLMLTDSGGLQEEAPSFGLPTVVLRNVTERPEGIETGILKLAGTDEDTIYNIASEILNDESVHERMASSVNPYGDGFAARKIVDAIRFKYHLTDERPEDFSFDVNNRALVKINGRIESTHILGVRIDKVNMEQAIEKIFSFFEGDRLHIVHTTNPEFILKAQTDELYKTILNGADLAVPDGIGAVIASKFSNVKLKDRVSGCDLAYNLMNLMQGTPYSVYILGASEERLQKAIKNLKEAFPNINICGYHNGYFKDPDDEEIIADINRCNPSLLLVGMGGIDKQEKWVWKYKDRLNAKASIGIGGSIDVYSGEVKRAPKLVQNMKLEWLYRTLSEPKKRLPRIYKLPQFVILAFKDSFKTKKK